MKFTFFALQARPINAATPDTLEIDVYDVIGEDWWTGEGVRSKDILALLKGSKAKTIHLRVNSIGGDVFEAVAIHNMLRQRAADGAHIVCDVDAMAASAASVIVAAADEVRVPANACIMIHEARTRCYGTAEEFDAAAATLRKINDAIADTYVLSCKRRGKEATREQMRASMAAETWMFGVEAVACGLADQELEPMKAAASLAGRDLTGLRNVPKALLEAPVAEQTAPEPQPRVTNNINLHFSGTTSPEAITAALKSQLAASGDEQTQAAPAAERTEMNPILKALGVASEAEALALIATLATLTAKSGAEMVAVIEAWKTSAERGAAASAELQELKAVNAKREKEQEASEASALIAAAVADGRLPPAKKENAEAIFAKFGSGALKAHLEALTPHVVPRAEDDRQPKKNIATGNQKISAEWRAVQKATGKTDEEILQLIAEDEKERAHLGG